MGRSSQKQVQKVLYLNPAEGYKLKMKGVAGHIRIYSERNPIRAVNGEALYLFKVAAPGH